LGALGEQKRSAAPVEEATQAFLRVMEIWTHDQYPDEWASTQRKLGNSLLLLGEYRGMALRAVAPRLKAALAHRKTLSELTTRRMPLKNKILLVLLRLVERRSGIRYCVKAVAAYRNALKVWTRTAHARDWANTQNLMGAALTRIGDWEQDTELLGEAVAAYRAAVQVYKKLGDDRSIRVVESNLSTVNTLLTHVRSSHAAQ
jgi:tetratricopeptide (TPR) repeat protein